MDKIKLNPFLGVAAGGLATLVTDELKGRSVHALMFRRGNGGGAGFTAAHMTNLTINLNGKSLLDDISGAQLQDFNDYEGLGASTDFLFHYFGDPTARTIRGQHQGDLDLSVHAGPLELKVDIAAAAVAPTLEVWALVGPPKAQMGLGFSAAEVLTVRALIPTVVQEAALVTRKSEPIGLGSGAGARIRKLAFFHANLLSVEVKKQGIILHEDLDDAENDAIQTDFGRVPQAGLYMVDFVVDGNMGEAQDTLRPDGQPWNYQVLVSTSAGDTIPTFADVHTAPQLL